MTKYKQLRGELTQEAAAAKTGISVSSSRRLESRTTLPSQRPHRNWRTRANPLADVWMLEVVPMLEAAPALMAVTILEELQRRHPELADIWLLRELRILGCGGGKAVLHDSLVPARGWNVQACVI